VVKVGGSLFDFPDLGEALRRFIDVQSPAATVLIAGGGPWADAVREVATVSPIGERTAHQLCVRAMGLTARLLAAWSPYCRLETEWQQACAWCEWPGDDDHPRVLDISGFWDKVDSRGPGTALPHDWSATSDSIAARVAGLLEADELVLLKSAKLQQGTSITAAAAAGYVDRFFPRAACGMRCVRCVCLRDRGFPEVAWIGSRQARG
jgi:aspartokinase-like uncharacterized kinase